jgi:hypothetical protein
MNLKTNFLVWCRAGRVRVKTRTRVDSSHIFWKTRTRLGLEIWRRWLDCVTRVIQWKRFSFVFIKISQFIRLNFQLSIKKLNILYQNDFFRSFFIFIHSYMVVNGSPRRTFFPLLDPDMPQDLSIVHDFLGQDSTRKSCAYEKKIGQTRD